LDHFFGHIASANATEKSRFSLAHLEIRYLATQQISPQALYFACQRADPLQERFLSYLV
jgi:hypothetical protein